MHRSPFAYRGLSSSSHSLESKFARLRQSVPSVERHLLRNFIKYSERPDAPQEVFWNWLALAQHYGLPTRLLDWTYSPQVALHFATSNLRAYTFDGAVWGINYRAIVELLPEALKSPLREEGTHVFTTELLSKVAKSLREYDCYAPSPADPFVSFFEPPSLDGRIVNQFALFSVPSNPHLDLEQWLKSLPEIDVETKEPLAFKIVIDKTLKWEIRDRLDQANITERVLFPGLDGLASWLGRYYSNRE